MRPAIQLGEQRVFVNRSGSRIVVRDPDRVTIVDGSGRDEPVELAGPTSAVAVFDDEVWVIDAGTPLIRRLRPSGVPLTGALTVDAVGGTLVAHPYGLPAAIHCGKEVVEVVARGDALAVSATLTGARLVLPFYRGRWVVVEGDHLSLRDTAGRRWELAAGERGSIDIVAGSVLNDGLAFALVRRSADTYVIEVRTSRDGSLETRFRIRQSQALRFAPGRGLMVALCKGALIAIDLRHGRVIGPVRCHGEPIDFDIDAANNRIVALVADGGDGHLVMSPLPGAGEDAASPSTETVAIDPVPAKASAPVARTLPVDMANEPVPALSEAELDRLLTAAHRLLWAHPDVEHAAPADALAMLGHQLQVVGSWCGRAIAEAWDNGRLSAPDGTLPYEREVDAVLARSGGGASDRLVAARARVGEAHAALRAIQASTGSRLTPLAQLVFEFGLSELAAEIILTVAAPVLWGELARLYGILSNDRQRALCDELLVAQVLGSERDRYAIARELDDSSPLRRFGLIDVDPGAPRPFAGLTAHPIVIARLRCADLDDGADKRDVLWADRGVDELTLPLAALRQWTADLECLPGNAPCRLVVRGRPGSGRRSLCAALAAAAKRPIGRVDAGAITGDRAHGLQRALVRHMLRGAIPCVEGLPRSQGDPTADARDLERIRLVLDEYPGPLFLRLPLDVNPPLAPGYVQIDLPAWIETERHRYWQAALARRAIVADAGRLATRYRIGPGVIERVLDRLAGRPATTGAVRDSEIDAAIRQHLELRLGTVATSVTRLADWSNVVLPPDIMDSVLEIVARVRHRRTVFEQWGFDHRILSGRGLTVLFQGPPGTGKTMVAGAIAAELGIDLYRVDLSRVLSKWLGETERNLSEVFDAAEDGQAILLFDEADSLFAKRTEVQSSVDRYANTLVNYLLQRLDSFDGIAVLTTNFGQSIDKAFKRRMSLRITFPFPDEETREHLWRVHLPPELPVAGDFDLADLSHKYRLSGGYIRNAALRAAFLAAEERSPVTQAHLERAIRLEFRETGKLADSGILE